MLQYVVNDSDMLFNELEMLCLGFEKLSNDFDMLF